MSGHTHSANPLACATALAVLQYGQEENFSEKVKRKGHYLKRQLHVFHCEGELFWHESSPKANGLSL